MPTTLDWREIALRLALSVLAGTLVGLNRMERGRPAGLRTVLLVCLAATIAMIEANLLLRTSGKTPDSFTAMDVMRLPLGILTGMGFIGGGAILRRDDLVVGVTTAATLWFVTVMGLCFGGGQIALGMMALALCAIVLWCLKLVEQRMRQDRHATLRLTAGADGAAEREIRSRLQAADFRIASHVVAYETPTHCRRVEWQIEWRSHLDDGPPAFLDHFAKHPDVIELEWKETLLP